MKEMEMNFLAIAKCLSRLTEIILLMEILFRSKEFLITYEEIFFSHSFGPWGMLNLRSKQTSEETQYV